MIKRILGYFFLSLLSLGVNAWASPFAYITNHGSGTISVIDTATDTVIGVPIPAGIAPYGVAVNPSGTRAYITNSNQVYVIDTVTNMVIGAPILIGIETSGVAINPSGTRVYVLNDVTGTVSVVDTATNTVMGAPIHVGSGPFGVAVNPSGTRVYVTNSSSSNVSVIDTATNTVITNVFVGSGPLGVVVNPSGTRVYVVNGGGNNVVMIDTSSNTVTGLPIPVGTAPYGIAVNPSGTRIYVTNRNSNNVSVIDTATNTVTATIPVGAAPYGVSVNPWGTRVYVANRNSNNVSVIDTATNAVIGAPIPVGTHPIAFGKFIGGQLGTGHGAQWAKTYGGIGAHWPGHQWANSIQQTADGGYIVAGASNSFGSLGFNFGWVLKLDADGSIQWEKQYGFGDGDEINCIRQTSDGGYIVAGRTYLMTNASPGNQAWVFKLYPNGTVEWNWTFGGGGDDSANSVEQTSDDQYIVAGSTTSFGTAGGKDIWVFKLNSNGVLVWQRTFGGANDDLANSIRQTVDEGYIVAGSTSSFGLGNKDAWILKLDGTGIPQWQKTYGGSLGDEANSIQQTSDGGYIAAGSTSSFGSGFSNAWVLKLDANGVPVWQKQYGHGDGDVANSIQQTSDGGFIVGGSSYLFVLPQRLYDAWVFKLDENGTFLWGKGFGGTDNDYANSVQETSDGGYVVAGETDSFGEGDSNLWVLKLDSSGNISNCPIESTLGASGITTTASGTSTSVTSGPGILHFPEPTPLTGTNTDATVDVQCFNLCTYSISPTNRSHGSGAETGTVGVTSPEGCEWTATSNNAWITITSGSNGTGNGTVNYSVSANPSSISRSGTITAAGQTFTVNQAGAECTYSISPTSRSHGSGAETGTVNVAAPTGCEWTATSNDAWVTITSGSNGTGNGTVNYSVSAYGGVSSRTGTLTIAGQTFTVTQSGVGPDLTGEWLSPSQVCKKGKCKVTLTLKVENIGSRDASSTSVRIYVSDDDTPDVGDIMLKELSIKNMVAGGSWSKKVKVTVSEDLTKYLIAVIDPENLLVETKEDNNQIVYGPIP